MQRQHLRIAMLTGDLVRLLDRLLRLNCELVPTNCHLCTPLLIPINYLSASRVACCSLIDLAGHSDASLAEAKRRKMNLPSPALRCRSQKCELSAALSLAASSRRCRS